MNQRFKVILLAGFLIPLLLAAFSGGACWYWYRYTSRKWIAQKKVYDRMQFQKQQLELGKGDLDVIAKWLPVMDKWFTCDGLSGYSSFLDVHCKDEVGIKLSGTAQANLPSHYKKGRAMTFNFSGRSGAIMEVLGSARQNFPTVVADTWALSKPSNSDVLSLSVTVVQIERP
jgi:hypothetical protein